MRLGYVWTYFVLVAIAMVSSCGKDHDEPSTTTPVTEPVDSLPSNWVKATTPNDTTDLIDIFFAGNTTGYAVGAAGEVWKSANGGQTWLSVYQAPDKKGFYNLAVTPNGTVYIVSAGLTKGIYTSPDGITFKYREVGSIYPSADVYFTGNDTGYISAARAEVTSGITPTGLWQTTDGGSNWQFVPVTGTNAGSRTNDFAFYNSAYGYVLSNANVFRTGGQYNGWSAPVYVTPSFLCSITAPSPNIAYAADYAGNIYKTTDGGVSFAQTAVLYVPSIPSYINIQFLNETTGYATTTNVLYKTTDGGTIWLPVLTSKNRLDEVHFTDAAHGWVCGANGTVLVYKP